MSDVESTPLIVAFGQNEVTCSSFSFYSEHGFGYTFLRGHTTLLVGTSLGPPLPQHSLPSVSHSEARRPIFCFL